MIQLRRQLAGDAFGSSLLASVKIVDEPTVLLRLLLRWALSLRQLHLDANTTIAIAGTTPH
jgi:hypothetical protein